jgi:hypothetical protein
VQECDATLFSELGEPNEGLGKDLSKLQLQHQVNVLTHNEMLEKYRKEMQEYQSLQQQYDIDKATHIATKSV